MKSAQISLKKQFIDVFLTHGYMMGISIVFGFGAFWWFLVQDTWKQLFSYVFIAIYFGVLYSKGHRIGIHDRKGYAQTKAYPLKGVVLSSIICLSIFILWVLYRFAWVYMSTNGSLSGYTATIINALYLFWTFPFNGIMSPYKGGIFWYAHIIIYLLPILSLGIGYYAGYKNFSIYEKISPIIYEKKK